MAAGFSEASFGLTINFSIQSSANYSSVPLSKRIIIFNQHSVTKRIYSCEFKKDQNSNLFFIPWAMFWFSVTALKNHLKIQWLKTILYYFSCFCGFAEFSLALLTWDHAFTFRHMEMEPSEGSVGMDLQDSFSLLQCSPCLMSQCSAAQSLPSRIAQTFVVAQALRVIKQKPL